MDRLRYVAVGVLLLVAACGSVGQEGDCLEQVDRAKAEASAVRERATDPGSPGGTRVTNEELRELRRYDDRIVEAERCL